MLTPDTLAPSFTPRDTERERMERALELAAQFRRVNGLTALTGREEEFKRWVAEREAT